MGAFRSIDGTEVLEAPTRDGTLRLEVAPRHVALALRAVQIAVTDEFITITEQLRRRVKRRSERLGGWLVAARDVPREDLGLWLELAPGRVERVFGAAPHDLIASDGLTALRALDALYGRLRQVLTPHAAGARRAFEIGRGTDKVLIVDYDGRLALYARRMFRDLARLVVEVHEDGTVVLPGWRSVDRFKVAPRFGVTVLGDSIRFIGPGGDDLGRVPLPWLEPEERQELARRFTEYVARGPQPRPTGQYR